MTTDEFGAWAQFYALFPFDDFSLHHRPAALIAQAAGGFDMDDSMRYLDRTPDPMAGFSEADRNTMKASGVKPPARS